MMLYVNRITIYLKSGNLKVLPTTAQAEGCGYERSPHLMSLSQKENMVRKKICKAF